MDLTTLSWIEFSILAGVAILLAALLLAAIIRFSARRRIHAFFDVDLSEYRLIAWDIGRSPSPLYLADTSLGGMPDAVFLHRRDRAAIVAEYKSRSHYGRPSLYEKYQVCLYMGLLHDRFKLDSVYALIRYAQHTERVAFNPHLYEHLRSLEDELRHARSRWIPPDPRPLHARFRPSSRL